MSIKYSNNSHCKTLQNLPKLHYFWSENTRSGNRAGDRKIGTRTRSLQDLIINIITKVYNLKVKTGFFVRFSKVFEGIKTIKAL
jgi:hypothetical protein